MCKVPWNAPSDEREDGKTIRAVILVESRQLIRGDPDRYACPAYHTSKEVHCLLE